MEKDSKFSSKLYMPVGTNPGKVKRASCSRPTILCVVFLVCSLALNVALVVFVLHTRFQGQWNDSINTGPRVPDNSICVSCESLNVPENINTDHLRTIQKFHAGNSILCCSSYDTSFGSIVNLVVGEYFHKARGGERTDSFSFNPATPSAHLYLHRNISQDQRLLWDKDTGFGTAHVSGGIKYHNGSLQIPQNGVYYLYSHVTINKANHSDSGDVVHCVYRYNPNMSVVRNQLLMISKRTVAEGDKKSNFLAANLRLRHQDQVFVTVSDTSYIYNFTAANYFGLYLL